MGKGMYKKRTKTCPNCKKTFTKSMPKKRVFCSRRCSFKYNVGEKHHRWLGGYPKCNDCGVLISFYSKRCFSCSKKYYLGNKSHNWKGGVYSNDPLGNKAFHQRRRLARIKGANGSHSKQEWEDLKSSCQFMCLCCGEREPNIKLTEDHILPISKGGSDDIENIQPLCVSCNSIKHDKYHKFNLSKNDYLTLEVES